MYTTPDEVTAATGYDEVTMDEVRQAQFVIEIFSGRMEGEVTGGRDKALLARAVMAQTVYMRDNPEVTFEQIAATSVSRGDGMTVFSTPGITPFIAPLAVMALNHVSWKKSQSVKIGKTVGHDDKMRILYWMSIWGSLSPYGMNYGLDGTSPTDYGLLVPFNTETWDEV